LRETLRQSVETLGLQDERLSQLAECLCQLNVTLRQLAVMM
jgi:hypothetical protein